MELHRLEIDPLTTLLAPILQQRSSGQLTIVSSHVKRCIHWAYGEIALIESEKDSERLPEYLHQRGLIGEKEKSELQEFDPQNVALQFTESEWSDDIDKLSVLRDWISTTILPLFSLEQGTVTFEEKEPLPPEQRVLVSTPSVVIEGIRSIQSGLILRSALGDLTRTIEPNPDPPYSIETLPLTDQELEIVDHLEERQPMQQFLREFKSRANLATRTVISLLTFGIIRVAETKKKEAREYDDTERDMSILASIAGNQTALEVLALSKQIDNMDHYKVLEVPLKATRSQIAMRIDELKAKYEKSEYPDAVAEAVKKVLNRIDEAREMLLDSDRRAAYDSLLRTRRSAAHRTVAQLAARRTLALQNIRKAENLALRNDHYTALVLLQQAVKFEPDNAKAWHLLGDVQKENPKWQRDAADAYMRALSIEPNRLETMIALGDLYFNRQMYTRARNHYQEVLQIDPVHELAQSRIKKLEKQAMKKE